MIDREALYKSIDAFFTKLNEDSYTKYGVEELITIIEAIIPVHVGLEIQNYDDVDTLLAIYPFLYQKLIKVYAYFVHEVRLKGKDTQHINNMRSYRDAFEQLMKSVKMNYDALSRRITNNIDRRA